MLIVLSMGKCGTVLLQSWGMDAMCLSRGEMIDLETNQIVWRVEMTEGEGRVPINGEWNQAPDFPSLTESVAKAVTQAEDYLVKDFFGNAEAAPTPKSASGS